MEPPKKRVKRVKEEEEEEAESKGIIESTPPKRVKAAKVSITGKVYKRVGEVFRKEFPGGYAGWAHSVLFLKELPSFKELTEKS